MMLWIWVEEDEFGPSKDVSSLNLQPERQEMTHNVNYFCRDYLFSWHFTNWVLSM